MSTKELSLRAKGARSLAAGVLTWVMNIALILTIGWYWPMLVILGAVAVFVGATALLWGDSLRTMPAAQKIPALLIALAVVVGIALALLRWTQAHALR